MSVKLNCFFLVLLILPSLSQAQNCRCEKVYAETKMTVENNYAGWFDKINFDNVKRYRDWSEPFKAKAMAITNDSLCVGVIKEWLAYFNDKQLTATYVSSAKAMSKKSTSSPSIAANQGAMNEADLLEYMENNKNLDAIEGIFENENYKLGISRVNEQQFQAIVLWSKNINQKPGEVKAVIRKEGKKYSAQFYNEEMWMGQQYKVQVVDNILDMEVMFLDKTAPDSKKKKDRLEYEIEHDIHAPSLKFKDGTAIFTFPSFDFNTEKQTVYLLKKESDQLKKTTHWIIDLRNNRGGEAKVADQLLKYLYTQPYVAYNSEMRMTPFNFDLWYRSQIKPGYSQLDPDSKKSLDAEMEVMKAQYGKNYNASGKMADTLTMNEVLPYPQKVALLINRNTLASGELFTLLARQSKKVTVMGENSGGMLDYNNVMAINTVCPSITLKMPINRQLWLEDFFTVDKAGIKPELVLKGSDWIKEAQNWLKPQGK
ncbi:MAG: hypothetical protein IPJ54_05515 [Saprospiraceae bacterium]|nr:hypothetical protein [Saprospiraceae bacterium]